MPGKTENLHIRSLVGRYLEHGRIYSFSMARHTRIYIASGDFLTRNTERRVEVGVRVDDPCYCQKAARHPRLQLRDTVNAREMQPDGTMKVKPPEGEPPVNSQMGMYELLRNDWTHPRAVEGAPRFLPLCRKTAGSCLPKSGRPAKQNLPQKPCLHRKRPSVRPRRHRKPATTTSHAGTDGRTKARRCAAQPPARCTAAKPIKPLESRQSTADTSNTAEADSASLKRIGLLFSGELRPLICKIM